MNVAIIVYPHTGHTLSMATKLQERLIVAGRRVTLEQLETIEPLGMGRERRGKRTRRSPEFVVLRKVFTNDLTRNRPAHHSKLSSGRLERAPGVGHCVRGL